MAPGNSLSLHSQSETTTIVGGIFDAIKSSSRKNKNEETKPTRSEVNPEVDLKSLSISSAG